MQSIKMVPHKHRSSLKKKCNSELELVISSLRKENDFLKKAVVESHHHYSALNNLLERFLALETLRLENSQRRKTQDDMTASEHLSEMEDKLMDGVSLRVEGNVSSCLSEIEELKDELVSISTRCQYLKNKVAANQDFTSDDQAPTDDIRKLQSDLKDALEKNKQWLEYDQQREAYVRGILARMLWLEKQLNEANQACSQQDNETHSDVDTQIIQMQGYYERLLQKAKDNLEELRDELDETQQNLLRTQCMCNEREKEVEELKQQLQTEKAKQEVATEDHIYSGSEEEHLSDEIGDLQRMLNKERRKSAHLEHQAAFREAYFKSLYHEDQRKIAELERQIEISSQDLEDERQNCLYLKKQTDGLVKMLQNIRHRQAKVSHVGIKGREQRDSSSDEAASPPTRDGPSSSYLQDESCLECPVCQTLYPACDYKELIHHLEDCQS
ncbi:centrosomal protein of 55 kDa-like [Cheilinus undulatus]|uniref:centrosomal protein of 55 kDa-like n=1 Tax=Cheilinus undulatus TaxID=241271 RepID=UPI001BD47A47|nr:centrosomal protein of 55 kDa-like [Cheilinus undulatus]